MSDGSGIRYAKTGGGRIAYEVIGDGPIDLLQCNESTMVSIDSLPGNRHWDTFDRKLASFARLIRFDRRGIGLSDGVTPNCPISTEQSARDALAVLDAVGSSRAVVLGLSGGYISITLSAMQPERVTHLVLFNACTHLEAVRGHPWVAEIDSWLDEVTEGASEVADDVAMLTPSLADDQEFRSWWQQAGRRGASPGAALEQHRAIWSTDVRPVLPEVAVPTLVIHRHDAILTTVEDTRYIADTIPDARLVDLPGADFFPFAGDADAVVDEVEEFLTGTRHAREPERLLTTVLFTDIVDSTTRAAAVGDREWRGRLDAHDAMVRRELRRFRGREVKHTGDGFLATFDGPGNAVRCGRAVADGARGLGIELRAGVHTGEVEIRGEDVGGLAVHIGARVAALAGAGEVLVSSTVRDLVAGSHIEFEDAGAHELKGVPGTWHVCRVRSA